MLADVGNQLHWTHAKPALARPSRKWAWACWCSHYGSARPGSHGTTTSNGQCSAFLRFAACSDSNQCCRPFTNAMAAQLVKALGASLTSIKQSNITVQNAIQVRLLLCPGLLCPLLI